MGGNLVVDSLIGVNYESLFNYYFDRAMKNVRREVFFPVNPDFLRMLFR